MGKTRYDFSKMSFAQLKVENKLHEFLKPLNWIFFFLVFLWFDCFQSQLYIFRSEFKFKRETKNNAHRFGFICFSKYRVTVYIHYTYFGCQQTNSHRIFNFCHLLLIPWGTFGEREEGNAKPRHNLLKWISFFLSGFFVLFRAEPSRSDWSICMSNEIDTIQFIWNGMEFVQWT